MRGYFTLACGEGGIRTLVTCFHINSLSRGALSATQPPLRYKGHKYKVVDRLKQWLKK